jgi:hypothetical protein
MALVKLERAAVLTGKSRSTIHRAMAAGKLSYSKDPHGERVVDVAELGRVFDLRGPNDTVSGNAKSDGPTRADSHDTVVEMARIEERNRQLANQVAELRADRDRWHSMAVSAMQQLTDQRQASATRQGFWGRLFG